MADNTQLLQWRGERNHTDEATKAVIGGEGNGGVIYPESHYGRDALVGIALFLSNVAHKRLQGLANCVLVIPTISLLKIA